jgi:methylenetetrahydrofolate reductase (NADPH)
MITTADPTTTTPDTWPALLRKPSVELVAVDTASIADAASRLAAGSEVFIANLPKHPLQLLLDAAQALRCAGLAPVPHIVARNIANTAALDALLGGLRQRADVTAALLVAGDQNAPRGNFDDSQQLLETGLFERHGFDTVYLAAHPEGHPRISNTQLASALTNKLALAADQGLAAILVSQFCFDSAAVLAWLRGLRATGVRVPVRVGVAGPASTTALLKFALLCGVGPSLRALQGKTSLARQMLAQVTPEALLRDLAQAQSMTPALNIQGAHFFTFGSLASTTQWLANMAQKA